MKSVLFKVVAVLVMATFTACTSPTASTTATSTAVTSPLSVTAVSDTLAFTVPVAVRYAVSKDPAVKPYLNDVAVVIDTFILGGSSDPTALTAALSTVGSKSLSTPEAESAITIGLSLYKTAYQQVVSQKLSQGNLGVILQSLSSAIKQGLL